MKATLPFLLMAVAVNAQTPKATPDALPATEIPRDVVAKIRTLSCNEFESHEHELEGQIIKLKFTYRDAQIENKGSVCVGMLQFWIDSSRKKTVDSGWGMVNVVFPKEVSPWFTKIPTNLDARGNQTVVGRVEKAEGATHPHVVLIGREIRTDFKGSRAVWQ